MGDLNDIPNNYIFDNEKFEELKKSIEGYKEKRGKFCNGSPGYLFDSRSLSELEKAFQEEKELLNSPKIKEIKKLSNSLYYSLSVTEKINEIIDIVNEQSKKLNDIDDRTKNLINYSNK